MTHTPGPWRVLDGQIVQTSHITRDVWTIPRNEDDVALILAAPDLLEAAEQMVNHGNLAAMDMLRAAIAKAKGEA